MEKRKIVTESSLSYKLPSLYFPHQLLLSSLLGDVWILFFLLKNRVNNDSKDEHFLSVPYKHRGEREGWMLVELTTYRVSITDLWHANLQSSPVPSDSSKIMDYLSKIQGWRWTSTLSVCDSHSYMWAIILFLSLSHTPDKNGLNVSTLFAMD